MSGYLTGLSAERCLRNDDEKELPPTATESFISLLEHEQGVKHTNPTDQEGRNQRLTHLRTCTLSRDHHHDRRHRGNVIRVTSQPIWTDLSPILRPTRPCDRYLLSTIYRCGLSDSREALNCLHESGWIHRNISAGNIYFFEGRGHIGDREYAKGVTMDGSHQMRTGSPDFMAVEVSANSYKFIPPKESRSDIYKRAKLRKDGKYSDQPAPRLQFVQNEGHDIESLWWISNYILFLNHDDSTQETRDQEEARMVWMPRIFPGSDLLKYRDDFLRDSGIYEENTQWFSDSFLELRSALKDVGRALVGSYTEMEAMLPNTVEGVFDILYDITIEIFSTCMDKSSNITISSFKTKGRKHQKDLSQASALPPPPADNGPIKVTDMPRYPGEKLGLRQP